MSIIDDPDFLTNRTKQLSAVRELANLRERLVDLQSELLNRATDSASTSPSPERQTAART